MPHQGRQIKVSRGAQEAQTVFEAQNLGFNHMDGMMWRSIYQAFLVLHTVLVDALQHGLY